MPHLTIKMDADESGFNTLEGVSEDKIIHVTAGFEVGTLRAGMQSGKDSVALCFKLPDGRVVIAETSADLYLASARAIIGWQEGRRDRGEG